MFGDKCPSVCTDMVIFLTTAQQTMSLLLECSNACGAKSVKMKKCGACSSAAYCSKQCQSEHWSTHRKTCKIITPSNSLKEITKTNARDRLSDFLENDKSYNCQLQNVILPLLSSRPPKDDIGVIVVIIQFNANATTEYVINNMRYSPTCPESVVDPALNIHAKATMEHIDNIRKRNSETIFSIPVVHFVYNGKYLDDPDAAPISYVFVESRVVNLARYKIPNSKK